MPLLCDFPQCIFGPFPDLFGAKVLFRLFGVVEGKARAKLETEDVVENVDHVPYTEQLLFQLVMPAERVRIVLRNGEYAREPAELARLLVAIDHGGLGVALRRLAVAVVLARE